MSFDVEIVVNHPDGYSSSFDVGNMTYNVSRMMVPACGVSFGWFDGMTAVQALPIARHAWQQMKRDPKRFRLLEAENGWGTYDQFMPYLTRFYVMLRQHPTGVIHVS